MVDEGGGELAFYDKNELVIPSGKWQLIHNPLSDIAAKQETDTELADFIKSESADLGKRRVTLRALQALRQQKQAEADTPDLEDLIEAERGDLRERFARMQDARAAARAKKPFVIPPLTTPEQPTTTRVMEQKAAAMTAPKVGARQTAAYSLPDKRPNDDWRGHERKDFVPTERQTIVMDAAKEAIDNGLFYEKDVDEFVAKKLNVSPAMFNNESTGRSHRAVGYYAYICFLYRATET